MKTCDICGKEFKNKRGVANHRRWHDLPEYKKFQEEFREMASRVHSGKILTEETKLKISLNRKGKAIGKNNPNWKGDDVGYKCLHDWVRKYKTKPKNCQHCGKEKKYLELANISGEYKRDINDYIYLCVRCHKIMDGNLQKFIIAGMKTRLKQGHKNELKYGVKIS